MGRVLQFMGLAGLLVSAPAFAQDEEPTTEAQPVAEETANEAPAPVAATPTPAVEAPAAPPATGPKVGDLSVSGYFRGGFGASNQKGRQTCFQLAIPGSLVSKYRLGNECEVWAELNLSTVVYVGDDGTVASVHFMPTAYVPTTYIGYSPTSTTSSPATFTTSTGATLSFPNLYTDIKGIPWLAGGTAWAGNRYYKREAIYISDFFYWNPSGVGAGVEDINLGGGIKVSYGVFAVDGQPKSSDVSSPPFPMQIDLGIRNDIQVRGFRPYDSGELQLGFQYIADFSNNKDTNGDSNTHGGWGVTLQHVQDILGGNNKLAVQYGKGGGTGFGTLSRFYYPDFSLYWAPSESRFRIVDVLTIQPTDALGAQVGVVYQHDNLGTTGTTQDWISAGTRVGYAFTNHFKVLGEVGFDQVKKSNGSGPLQLTKFTIAPTIAAAKGFYGRPEVRLFYTWAMWNANARTATVDSGRMYTDTNKLSGAIFGIQTEAMW
jgi:maltoporin